jgi:hypothetical protein
MPVTVTTSASAEPRLERKWIRSYADVHGMLIFTNKYMCTVS